MPYKLRLLLLILALSATSEASRMKRPIPAGLLFPAFPLAGYVNPSILPLEKGTAFMGTYTFANGSSGTGSALAGAAHSKKDRGVGLGYIGSFPSGGSSFQTQQNGAFAGGGIKMENVSVGVSADDSDLSTGLNPNINIAVTAKLTSALIGAVVRSVNGAATPQMAVGYGSSRYSLEANVSLPTFSQIGTTNGLYSLGISGAIYGDFTVAFNTSYNTSFGASGGYFLHSLWTLVWLSDSINLLAQFASTETITVGMTIVL